MTLPQDGAVTRDHPLSIGDTITCLRQGLRVVTTATRGEAARESIVDMRERHYQAALVGLGVALWDRYDMDGVHFLCTVEGVPVASMRSTQDSVRLGEAAHDFPDLAARLPERTGDFLYLSRQLVVPRFRKIGLAALLTNSAALWWRSRSALDYVVASTREPATDGARRSGVTVLAGPNHLGPRRTPVFLIGGDLAVIAGNTGALLEHHGWVADPSGQR